MESSFSCVLRHLTVQVMVVPISEASLEYAQQVRLQLRKAKLHVDVDATDRKMQKKVREAQLAQYNYILVSASAIADSVLFTQELAVWRTHHNLLLMPDGFALQTCHRVKEACGRQGCKDPTVCKSAGPNSADLQFSLLGTTLMLSGVMGGCCMLPSVVFHKGTLSDAQIDAAAPEFPCRWWVSRR